MEINKGIFIHFNALLPESGLAHLPLLDTLKRYKTRPLPQQFMPFLEDPSCPVMKIDQ